MASPYGAWFDPESWKKRERLPTNADGWPDLTAINPPPPTESNRMDRMRGAMNAPALPPRRPGLLDVPGMGENWYAQNKYRWGTFNRAANYWNGKRGSLAPQNSRGAYNEMGRTLGGMQRGATGAYRASESLLNNGPGAGERAAREAGGYFRAPGEMERYYNNVSGYFTGPAAGEQWVTRNMGGFEGPGAAEQNLARAQGNLAKINYGEQAIRDVRPFANSQDMVTGEFRYFQPELRAPSYSEELYESGRLGLIDPYARAQEKQTRKIRDAAAARGMFNTGASLRSEEELAADIAAQEARDRISLAGQADTQRLGRIGAAESFATSAERGLLGRKSLGLDAYGLASKEGLEKVGLETDAAKAAQENQINRLFTGGKLALMGDESARSRLKLGGELADRSQTLGMTRNNNLVNAGKTEQDLYEGRLKLGSDLGLSADDRERMRVEALFRGASDLDDRERRGILDEFGIERTLDQDEYGQFRDEFEMAKDVQRLFEDRERNGLNDILRSIVPQVSAMTGGLTGAGDEYGAFGQALVQNLIQQTGMSYQQAQQMVTMLFRSGEIAALTRGQPGPNTAGGNSSHSPVGT